MIIRLATIDDLNSIKLLDKQWEAESNIGGESGIFYKKCITAKRVYVAELNSSIVGFSLFTLKRAKKGEYSSLKKGQYYLFVDYIFVLKKYRSEGVGNKLLKTMEEYAKSIKVTSLYLYAVSDEPERLISFYKKKGYDVSYVMMYKKFN